MCRCHYLAAPKRMHSLHRSRQGWWHAVKNYFIGLKSIEIYTVCKVELTSVACQHYRPYVHLVSLFLGTFVPRYCSFLVLVYTAMVRQTIIVYCWLHLTPSPRSSSGLLAYTRVCYCYNYQHYWWLMAQASWRETTLVCSCRLCFLCFPFLFSKSRIFRWVKSAVAVHTLKWSESELTSVS